MRKSICIALILLSTTCAHAKFKKVASFVHQEMCEASAAVALPDGPLGQLFVVANDDDNRLRAYSATADGASIKIKNGNLDEHLRLDKKGKKKKKEKADLEGATTLNGKIYWIASHSRNSDGEQKKGRLQFFSTTITQDGKKLTASPSRSSNDLLKEIAALDKIFAKAIELDEEEVENLAPEDEGLNIEGLTVRADGKSMFIGLRNPLSREREAFLIPFENPEAVTEGEEKPILSQPVKLKLGGRGIRSIEYSPAANAYFIIAGPSGNSGCFELYRWSGNSHDNPVAVEGSAAEFAEIKDFHPEAMFIDASGTEFHILSDDGDRKVGRKEICKDADDEDQSFRSFVFTLK